MIMFNFDGNALEFVDNRAYSSTKVTKKTETRYETETVCFDKKTRVTYFIKNQRELKPDGKIHVYNITEFRVLGDEENSEIHNSVKKYFENVLDESYKEFYYEHSCYHGKVLNDQIIKLINQ